MDSVHRLYFLNAIIDTKRIIYISMLVLFLYLEDIYIQDGHILISVLLARTTMLIIKLFISLVMISMTNFSFFLTFKKSNFIIFLQKLL